MRQTILEIEDRNRFAGVTKTSVSRKRLDAGLREKDILWSGDIAAPRIRACRSSTPFIAGRFGPRPFSAGAGRRSSREEGQVIIGQCGIEDFAIGFDPAVFEEHWG